MKGVKWWRIARRCYSQDECGMSSSYVYPMEFVLAFYHSPDSAK
jgi:hypothetical protein